MGRRDPECRHHRAALGAFAAGGDDRSGFGSALDHLDRCSACAGELQELALAAVALRRLGEMPGRAIDGSTAWPRLRERIVRSRASAAAMAWRWRATLAGLAAATLVVAAVVGPLALHLPLGATGAELVGYSARELDLLSVRIEERYVLDAKSPTATTTAPTTGSQVSIPRRYPDGLTPGREGGEAGADLAPAGRDVARVRPS
jgi:hypothetical protein